MIILTKYEMNHLISISNMFTQEIIDQRDILKQFIFNLQIWIWEIKDIDLMTTVFVHKSYAADYMADLEFNERLEFLWDWVLWAIVNKLLFLHYKDAPESKLTLLKIWLVREETLAELARDINIWDRIFLWKWEKRQLWAQKDSILSDAVEALIWFLYIDWWIEVVENFLTKYLFPKLEQLSKREGKSYKSLMQENIQKIHKQLPEYQTQIHETDDWWNPLYYKAILSINWKILGEWIAKNKKRAQEAAAKQAYESNALK